MALRQRTWVILIRPYYIDSKNDRKIHYTKTPKAGRTSDLGSTSGTDTAVRLKGEAEGMEDWNTLGIDSGGWTMWYATTSFPRLREKYRECLVEHAKEFTRVIEVMPVDTLVTPLS